MKNYPILLVVGALLFSQTGGAAGDEIVGVVTGIERRSPPTIQLTVRTVDRRYEVRSDGRTPVPVMKKQAQTRTITLRTNEQTEYRKWITHRPWPQDTGSDSEAIEVGRCVAVDLRSGTPDIDEFVRINADPAKSEFDPCRTQRR